MPSTPPPEINGLRISRTRLLILAAASSGELYEEGGHTGTHRQWAHRQIWNISGVGPTGPRIETGKMIEAQWLHLGRWSSSPAGPVREIRPTNIGTKILADFAEE